MSASDTGLKTDDIKDGRIILNYINGEPSSRMITIVWQRVKKVGEAIDWISGIVASLVALVHAYPDLSKTAQSIYESMTHARPSSTAVFASNDRPFAESYLKLLAERGIKTRT